MSMNSPVVTQADETLGASFDSTSNSIRTSDTGNAVEVATADSARPAAGNNATINYAADIDQGHVISGVAWSYSAAPTNGNLHIQDGAGTIYFSIDITAAGPGFIVFAEPKKFPVNTIVSIVLLSGGAAVVGKVNAINHWLE